MILSYVQNLIMRKYASNLYKQRKKKKHPSDFSTLSIDDVKTKKKTNLFCWYKNTQQQPKRNNIYTNRETGLQDLQSY